MDESTPLLLLRGHVLRSRRARISGGDRTSSPIPKDEVAHPLLRL